MNVVRWRPFEDFENLFQTIERPSSAVRRADWLPLVDVRERASGYEIDIEIPAVAAEDLSVDVSDGVLTVTGERKSVEVDEDSRAHRSERRYGRFVRSFQLPKDADAESVSAESRDGVLYLVIAKRQSAVPKSIEVKVV